MKKKLLSLLLFFSCLLAFLSFNTEVFAADYVRGENMILSVNGIELNTRFLNLEYDCNRYISLRDLAVSLSGTEKAFSFTANATDGVIIERGGTYIKNGYENKNWDSKTLKNWTNYTLKTTKMTVDGKPVKYYGFFYNPGGGYDFFIAPLDAAFIFDLDFNLGSDNKWHIDTTKGFTPDIEALKQSDLFNTIHSAFVGDLTTGEIFFSEKEDTSFAMASTTKLMTVYLAYKALRDGKIGVNDVVSVTDGTDAVSRGTDVVIYLYKGHTITVWELITGCLLPSSNESAYALGEYIAGTEEAFVDMMNECAASLNMTGTLFYNSHGLPSFTEDLFPSKRQNYTTAMDMYKLASAIVTEFPEITSVTGLTECYLPSLNDTVFSSNSLVYNMDEVVGLKTGTTNQAGCCLVAYATPVINGTEHKIISVLYGAETNADRNRISTWLIKYAEDMIKNPKGFKASPVFDKPTDAKGLFEYLKKFI